MTECARAPQTEDLDGSWRNGDAGADRPESGARGFASNLWKTSTAFLKFRSATPTCFVVRPSKLQLGAVDRPRACRMVPEAELDGLGTVAFTVC